MTQGLVIKTNIRCCNSNSKSKITLPERHITPSIPLPEHEELSTKLQCLSDKEFVFSVFSHCTQFVSHRKLYLVFINFFINFRLHWIALKQNSRLCHFVNAYGQAQQEYKELVWGQETGYQLCMALHSLVPCMPMKHVWTTNAYFWYICVDTVTYFQPKPEWWIYQQCTIFDSGNTKLYYVL